MKKGILSLLLLVTITMTIFWWRTASRHMTKEGLPATLLIGTSADFKPFSFVNEAGDFDGFDIELIQEISKRLNIPFTISDMPFEVLIPQLQLGSLHIVAAGMTPTPERANKVAFSSLYISHDPLCILSRIDNPITNVDQLKDKVVIVNQGYTADIQFSKKPELNLLRLPSVADALLALNAHRGDAFITAQLQSALSRRNK
jgi:arginine/lysine/histidine transporter system substrate-binding protein